jgi:hypothetical protein
MVILSGPMVFQATLQESPASREVGDMAKAIVAAASSYVLERVDGTCFELMWRSAQTAR